LRSCLDREEFALVDVERLPVIALPLVSPLGAELVDVDLVDAEVRVGPELLRLLA
jgi:hypothetical protein